jgi:hypothetical protein
MEAMRQQGIDTLAKMFSYDVAEMIMFFQGYFYNPRQFDSVEDRDSNYPQFISGAGRQLDTRSFTDTVKKARRSPHSNAHVRGFLSIT